jgi:putative membrane protein
MKKIIQYYFTGFFMGTADLVPGVSGGTIALIAGIYEKLLSSIKTVTGEVLKLLLQGKIKQAINLTPLAFLLPLGLGIISAIFILAHPLSWALTNHPAMLWSFFFGLVGASIIILWREIKIFNINTLTGFILATIIAYWVVGLVPIQTPTNALITFFSGAIAICAMILPGISGSFILLILGQYQHILNAVTSYDLVTLTIFIVGCIVGLALFVRLLSWLLKKYHAITLAILAGIILGSMRKIWPWKEIIVEGRIEKNIIPAFDLSLIISLILIALGFGLVLYFNKLTKKDSSTSQE